MTHIEEVIKEASNQIEQYLEQAIPNASFTTSEDFSPTSHHFFFPSEEYFMKYDLPTTPKGQPEPIVLTIINAHWFRVLFEHHTFDYVTSIEAVDKIKELYYSE